MFNFDNAILSSFLSTSSSMSFEITFSSVPRISDKRSSFPSQSTFNGSSIETSSLSLLLRRRYISISFSMHLDAYVASFMFLSGLKVFIAFISPIVPIEMRSSTPTPVLSNFFAIYTTSLRLCSIRLLLASLSSSPPSFFITCSSSSIVSGAGSISAPPI